jgi:CRP/FNR family cyclic AMP-dependent transcriptional regulator
MADMLFRREGGEFVPRLARRSDRIDLLKTVPLFRGLTLKQLNELARHVEEVPVPRGTMLAREGQPGNQFFVVLEGKAAVRRRGRRIATLGEGDFFGEMSILDGAPRSATVAAETDGVVLVMQRREFGALLDRVPGLLRKIAVGLSQRLREADERILD